MAYDLCHEYDTTQSKARQQVLICISHHWLSEQVTPLGQLLSPPH